MAYGVSRTVPEKFIDFCSNLQHGGGIDADWSVWEPKTGKNLYFSNSYHLMDENGFYAGWQDFTLVISKKNWANDNYTDFTIEFNNGVRYLTEQIYLKEYLYDTFHYTLGEMRKEKLLNDAALINSLV
jgi:hypothetical protein